MFDMLRYAYAHLNAFKLILCCSEGTKYSGLIDTMVEIETEATHAYQQVRIRSDVRRRRSIRSWSTS